MTEVNWGEFPYVQSQFIAMKILQTPETPHMDKKDKSWFVDVWPTEKPLFNEGLVRLESQSKCPCLVAHYDLKIKQNSHNYYLS